MVSSVSPSPQDAFVHGRLINLVRTGRASTRPVLEQESGLGRKSVALWVEQAIESGLIQDGGFAPSGGGRPSRRLAFRADAGHIFCATVQATEMTAAVATLDGALIATAHEDWDATAGPEATLDVLDTLFIRLARKTRTEPWAFGIGIAGPVDFATGRLVAPPILPGWDGFSVRSWLRDRYDAPVWVDNDVNLMALGEWHRGSPHDERDLLYVLLDEGVGAGLVSRGVALRGDTGAAGDIGHIQVTDDPNAVCRCGQVGCLEALIGGWSIVQRLAPHASESEFLSRRLAESQRITVQDLGIAAAGGDERIRQEMLASTRLLGTTVANLVNFVNPGTVVLGGGGLRVGTEIFDEFEDSVRSRVTRLAGKRLSVRPSSMNFREGVTGAAILAVEHLFDPAYVGLWIENGNPIGRGAPLQQGSLA